MISDFSLCARQRIFPLALLTIKHFVLTAFALLAKWRRHSTPRF